MQRPEYKPLRDIL